MNAGFQQWLHESIEQLKAQNLYKQPPILETPQGGRVRIGGREVINLASNNYLGLANDPRLKQAAIEAAQQWGAGAGAVRWLGGTNTLYETLEQKLAAFKKTEAVLVFQSGFNANSGTIPSCFVEGDVIISDELNHASIIDGVRLSSAKYKKSEGYVYEHKNMNHLEDILKRCGHFKKRLIVTDGVFSMDGDIAPLPEIVELAERYDAVVMVDDAHASGVLGEHGSGTTSHFGLYGRVDIQLGTLSKAIGVIGGYIAGSRLLKEWLINRGRPYLFSTALPPPPSARLSKPSRSCRPTLSRCAACGTTPATGRRTCSASASTRWAARRQSPLCCAATKPSRSRWSACSTRQACSWSGLCTRLYRRARRACAPCPTPPTPAKTSTTRSKRSRRSASSSA
jgi:glycine C-acetyltransferase